MRDRIATITAQGSGMRSRRRGVVIPPSSSRRAIWRFTPTRDGTEGMQWVRRWLRIGLLGFALGMNAAAAQSLGAGAYTADALGQIQQKAAALEGPAYLADRLAALGLVCDTLPAFADWALASRVRYAWGFLVARAERVESDDPVLAQDLRREAIWRLRSARNAGLRRIPAGHPALASGPPSAGGSSTATPKAQTVYSSGSSTATPQAQTVHSSGSSTATPKAQTVYWTAAAWGALISLDREDLDLLADWPRAEAMAAWLAREHPNLGEGAVRVLAAGFELARPGGNPQRAREWLEAALEQFGRNQASLHLALADWVDLPEARERGTGDALRRRLEKTLSVAETVPSMENSVAAARAAWLLSRIEDLY